MAFEIRVPRGMAFGWLRPAGVRMLGAAANGGDGLNGGDGDDRVPAPPLAPRDQDVELAVRERLYGTRPNPRRA